MKNKKYYWMKMEADFYYRHDIKYFLSSNKGLNIVIVYQMLMLESISHEGRLRFNKEKPYTIEMLHNIFFTAFNDLETTEECFKALEDMDLIKWEKDQTLYIKGVEERIGSTTEQAIYMQEYRTKKDNEKLQESLQCKPSVRNCKKNVITNVSLDIDIEKEKEIDIDTHNNACACEEAQISKLQDLLNELQMLYGRCLTMMEQAQVEALSKNYDSKLIIDEIKNNLDKTNPIAYVMKKIQNTRNTNFNKGYDDSELLEDEWLKAFNERNK